MVHPLHSLLFYKDTFYAHIGAKELTEDQIQLIMDKKVFNIDDMLKEEKTENKPKRGRPVGSATRPYARTGSIQRQEKIEIVKKRNEEKKRRETEAEQAKRFRKGKVPLTDKEVEIYNLIDANPSFAGDTQGLVTLCKLKDKSSINFLRKQLLVKGRWKKEWDFPFRATRRSH